MPSAFVSHSSPDDRYVQEMAQYLRTLGYDEVFNDGHTIEPDQLFWERIEQGIRDCDAFVVILSHASVKSYWVDREVELAREQAKRVIPVRIDDCKLPSSFEGRHVIDLRVTRDSDVQIVRSPVITPSHRVRIGRGHLLSVVAANVVLVTLLWVATHLGSAFELKSGVYASGSERWELIRAGNAIALRDTRTGTRLTGDFDSSKGRVQVEGGQSRLSRANPHYRAGRVGGATKVGGSVSRDGTEIQWDGPAGIWRLGTS